MKAVDVVQNVQVILSGRCSVDRNLYAGASLGKVPFKGTIASSEVRKAPSGGQFSVLVLFDGDRAPRWVSGGRLQKVSF